MTGHRLPSGPDLSRLWKSTLGEANLLSTDNAGCLPESRPRVSMGGGGGGGGVQCVYKKC